MSNDTPTPNGTVWIQAWSADGFKLGLTLPAATVGDVMKHLDDVRKAGLLASAPSPVAELADDEKADTITTVVRRERVNKFDKTVSIIDCYFEFGKHPFTKIYLDEDEDVAEFERQSGLKVKDLPLYESDASKTLDPDKPNRFERKCPTPFVAIKKENGTTTMNGVEQKQYRFDRYGAAKAAPAVETPAPAPTPPVDDLTSLVTMDGAKAFVAYWEAQGVAVKDMLEVLGVPRFSLYAGKRTDADALMQKWVDGKNRGGNALSSSPFQSGPKRRL